MANEPSDTSRNQATGGVGRRPRRRDLLVGGGSALAAAGVGALALAQPAGAATSTTVPVYSPITPIRYFDTRDPDGPGPIPGGVSGELTPTTRFPDAWQAICFNLTIVDTVGAGYLAIFASDVAWPGNSSINWYTNGQILANSVYTNIGADQGITVLCGGADNSTDFVLDIVAVLALVDIQSDLGVLSPASLAPGAAPVGVFHTS